MLPASYADHADTRNPLCPPSDSCVSASRRVRIGTPTKMAPARMMSPSGAASRTGVCHAQRYTAGRRMIGRTEPVAPFALLRWARQQGRNPALTPAAAHVLLVLATYCDPNAKCFPSIETLRLATGYKSRSTIDRALEQLHDAGLIWSEKQRGRGKTACRELLFNPALEPRQRGTEGPITSKANPLRQNQHLKSQIMEPRQRGTISPPAQEDHRHLVAV